jgi:hypothetical protein
LIPFQLQDCRIAELQKGIAGRDCSLTFCNPAILQLLLNDLAQLDWSNL